METKVEVNPTPKQMAELLWSMNSEDQAEMFHHLYNLADGDYYLMMQFMCTRDHCEERKKKDFGDNALDAFRAMFSSAYKYMGT